VRPVSRPGRHRTDVADDVQEAYPWSESLRAELVTGHMPPWHVLDDVGAFKNAPTITAPKLTRS
jgi:hypothetical protein